jgi:hypothetical protein
VAAAPMGGRRGDPFQLLRGGPHDMFPQGGWGGGFRTAALGAGAVRVECAVGLWGRRLELFEGWLPLPQKEFHGGEGGSRSEPCRRATVSKRMVEREPRLKWIREALGALIEPARPTKLRAKGSIAES